MVTMDELSLSKEKIKKQREELKIRMGKILFNLRKERGYGTIKIARLLGVSKQTVKNQENGITQVMHDQLEILSDFYELPVSYFYGQTEYDSKTMLVAHEIANLPEELTLAHMHMARLQKKYIVSRNSKEQAA